MRKKSLALPRTCVPRGSISHHVRAVSQVVGLSPATLPERKLAAIMAADVVEYSRLMHENEEAALATLSGHRAIIDDPRYGAGSSPEAPGIASLLNSPASSMP